ncbi:MAG TPA: response regulator, partial [Nitrososphaera sp.]
MLQKISLSRVQTQAPPGKLVMQGKAGVDPFSSQTTSRANPWALSYSSQLMQSQSSQAPQIPLQPIIPSQKFIMVIDDSLTVRKILETCLSREGFLVKSFQDGTEAMRWLAEPQASTPDLIWLDIGLPKLDGYEVARHIKSKPRFCNTIIVMLSRRDGV